MDVTTVSPSPASPTEGDDLCETDVTDVATHSVTLLLCLCGLVGNGAVLCLLSRKFRNFGIFALAFADFLFLLFTVPSTLLFLAEDLSCSLIMPLLYLNLLFQLPLLSCYCELCCLTFTLHIVDVLKLCCRCNISLYLRWLVFSFQYWTSIALFIAISAVTVMCPTYEQGPCRAALISLYIIILLLFAVPVVTFHTKNFIKTKWGSKKQKPKRRDMVLFFMVLFILLLSLCNFLQQLGYIIMPSQVFFLLNCIHSSIKPFIYFWAGRCWSPCSLSSLQLSLQRLFDEQEEETAAAMMPPRTQASKPGDPLHFSAEGVQESG